MVKIKIAYISASTFPGKAANNVHVVKMCEGFRKLGHDVTLFAYEGSQIQYNIFQDYAIDSPFTFRTIPYMRNGKRRSPRILSMQLVKLLAKEKFDLLYSRNSYAALFSLPLRIPIVYETHVLPSKGTQYWLEKVLLLSKNLVLFTAITESLKQDYLKRYPKLFSKKNIIVLPDGASLKENVSENELARPCKTVGYVGHLYDGRGIDVIISLAKKMPHLEFLLVGGEDSHVAHWKEQCEDVANIAFTGYVNHSDVEVYYRKMDILIAPYQSVVRTGGNRGDTSQWMSPLKIFEYMAYMRPIVASDLPVLREVLQSEKNCLLCQCSDIDDWELKIQLLVKTPALRRQLALAAYQDLKEHYTWEARAKKILSEISEHKKGK